MAESTFISKQKSEVDDLNFDALREAGIKLIQALSGERWTDYNVHDPGVTILEALCYGLSDLAYRTGFDTADYFATTDGRIDYDALALFRPDEILVCDPVTIADLRKKILDEIPQISNVWLEPLIRDGFSLPVYSAFVELQGVGVVDSDDILQQEIEKRLRVSIGSIRALGEDIDSIEFVQVSHFGLSGEVEIKDGLDTLAILAEIHWLAQNYLNPRPRWSNYQDAFSQGAQLEQLLTGPLARTGYMPDAELPSWREQFFISELIGIVAGLPGVERVSRLAFVDADGSEVDSIDIRDQSEGRRVAVIKLGAGNTDIRLTVLRAGQRKHAPVDEVDREINRLVIQRNQFQSRVQQFDWISSLLPLGEARPFSEYYSIQHHFPDNYGLNAFGVPDSADALRQAQALQLKGYLLLHEQTLANFLAQIKLIPELFAVAANKPQTYAYQPLGDDSIPRIEEIYPQGIAGQLAHLDAIFVEFDDWIDRRHRVLNRLLAMHGHDDTRKLVDTIAHARGVSARDALPAKQCLLANIRVFGKSRTRGGNIYADDADESRPGLERNLCILFGGGISPSDVVEDVVVVSRYSAPIRVVDHVLLRGTPLPDHATTDGTTPGAGFFHFRVSVVVSSAVLATLAGNATSIMDDAIALCCPAHIAAEVVCLDQQPYDEFIDCLGRWRAAIRQGNDRDRAIEAVALSGFLHPRNS